MFARLGTAHQVFDHRTGTEISLTHNGRYVDWTPQRSTLNRIAHVYADDGVHTQYSYDPHGNVEWVRQEIPELGTNYVRYEYDLISGNMLRMLYDEGWEDQYIQRYRYDEDNRLREVESSRDGEIYESDARYTYYAHGPLRRVEYGEDSVQGIDYTYTLQGWLKAINHPSLDTSAGVDVDPGSDGFGTRRWFAPDAFGMMLGYYDGDFVHGNSPFASGSSVPASSYHLMPSYDLYNGNIATWTTNIQPAGTGGPIDEQLVGYTYRYDVLNRLLEANYHTYGSGGTWTGSLSEYTSSYTYDPNGNITTLTRLGDTAVGAMDQLTYTYYPGTNQLRQVNDVVSSSKYSEDIDDQSDTSNYTYDAIGNMTGDVSEGITDIEWSIYGKVLSVTKANQVLEFTYDAAGNRVRKQVYDPNDPSSLRSTYYVYEAGGKVVAIYENCVDPEPSPHEGVDTDNDGIPDTCDPDPMNPSIPPPGGDIDGDGVPDAVDPCPCTAGPAGDQDSDGIPDGTDPNPCAPNCAEAFHLTEWVIYGNGAQGRIAETKPTDLARPAGEGTAIDTTNEYHERVLSEKYYELKDHLGNVRVVVTDMKEPTVQSGTYPFVAVVSSYANYYAYGMLQPGRHYEGAEWRYGFNGWQHETSFGDDRSTYNTEHRLVDGRIARWTSVDPEAAQSTPYALTRDNPIALIDPYGDDDYFFDSRGNIVGYRQTDGTTSKIYIADKRGAITFADVKYSLLTAVSGRIRVADPADDSFWSTVGRILNGPPTIGLANGGENIFGGNTKSFWTVDNEGKIAGPAPTTGIPGNGWLVGPGGSSRLWAAWQALREGEIAAFLINEAKVGVNALNYLKGVATEEGFTRAIEVMARGLTTEMIADAKMIQPASKMKNQAVTDAMMAITGDVDGWGKYSTKTIELSNGESYQIHFYMNSKTGQIIRDIDFKAKQVRVPGGDGWVIPLN